MGLSHQQKAFTAPWAEAGDRMKLYDRYWALCKVRGDDVILRHK